MKGSSRGLDVIKNLALRHGEKAIMAMIVAIAGYLLYSIAGHESLPSELQADKLDSLAKQVDRNMNDYTWEQAVEKSPGNVRQYEQRAGNTLEIDSDMYAVARSSWDPPVVPPTVLRADPHFLLAYDLEGHGLTGLFAFVNDATARNRELDAMKSAEDVRRKREREREREAERGGRDGFFSDEGFRGRGTLNDENRRPVNGRGQRAGVALDGLEEIKQLSAAVVLAKVPLPEQLQAYKNTFENTQTYAPSQDYPQYLGYYVQRAEVRRGEELVWQNVSLRNGKDRVRLPFVASKTIELSTYDWAQGLEEIMDPRFEHPLLTFPQPPLVGRNWDELAMHSEVPVASEMEEEMLEDEERLPPDNFTEDDMFSNLEAGGGRFAGRGGGRRRGSGGIGRDLEGMHSMEQGGSDGIIGGRKSGRGIRRVGGGENFDENGELMVDVPFKMLRFFDLSVQPGKRYKYRVKLIFSDPNYMQPTQVLSPEVLARKRTSRIVGEWSKPSPTLSIPQAGVIRVAETTDSGSRARSEPIARMLVESFGIDEKGNAQQAFKELVARRGSVMNFQGEVEVLVEGGRFIEKIEDFGIDTGVTVLDIDGGEKYTREMTAPTQTLFMDASGRLYLRDELRDEREVAMHRAMFDESKSAGRGRGGFEGFGEL